LVAPFASETARGGPLRIVLVSANFRPSVGGIEQFVEILAGGLAEHGHAVSVVTSTAADATEPDDPGAFRIVRIPASDVLLRRANVPYPLPAPLAAVRTLRRLLADADVVHPQDAIYATSVATLILAHRAGVPAVLTQHVGFVPQRRLALDSAQRAAITTLGRSARLARVVATYNPAVAEWARRTWRLKDVRVLPVGVPAPSTSPSTREDVRAELGLRDDAFVAVFTGRDVPKKHLDVVLAARGAAYTIVAVTDRRSDGTADVKFVPFMSPERYRRLLGAADAFVLPSEGEGFPLALQEALVAGLPCVVTPGPGYEHYVRPDEVLFVRRDPAEIRESLVRLAGDERLRADLAARARSAGLREFGVDRFVEEYENVYREAIALTARDG
jgi:D-inositol-3-phosphate glycosyltransferase